MVIGITGGTGGLGKRLTEYLLSKGFTVRVLVRITSQVDELLMWGAEPIYGDVNDPAAVADFVKNLDICYHIAAKVASTSRDQLFKVNVDGTKTICDIIQKSNPHCHLIYCSSIVVKDVNWLTKYLLSDYTMSKYEAEKVVTKYMLDSMKITIIYPGYIYGPYDKNFMPAVIKLLKNIRYLIKGGETCAPVVFIDDLCELFYLAGNNPIAIGKKYFSLRKNEVGMHGFLSIVADKMNYSFPKKIYPKIPMIAGALIMEKVCKLFKAKTHPPITMRMIGVLSKKATHFNDDATRELGWNHKVSIHEGVDRAIEWYKSGYLIAGEYNGSSFFEK